MLTQDNSIVTELQVLYTGRNYRKPSCKIYDFITLPISLEEVNIYSNDIVNNVKGLVKREIIRMQDFNNLSENRYINDELIYDILASYDIRLNEEEVDKNVI